MHFYQAFHTCCLDSVVSRCACESQWQGDEQCGSCTSGFKGADCSVVEPQLPSQPPQQPICALGQGGYLYQFDGHGIVLQEFNTYYLMKVDHFSVQVIQSAFPSLFCPVFRWQQRIALVPQ